MTRMLLGTGIAGGVVGVLLSRPPALSETQALLLLGAALVIGAARVRRRLGLKEV